MLLLKVIHRVDDSVVEWKKVEMNPNNKFKKGINCNLGIEALKKMNIKVPGIGGVDFLEANRKNVIACIWQLVRVHYLKIIGTQSEDDLIKWANKQVESS